jgi:signal peptidase I
VTSSASLRGLPKAGVLTLLLALALVSPANGETTTYVVPSESMEPAFSAGERVTVDLDAYDTAQPELGDVVVVHPPRGAVTERCGVRRRPKEPCRVPTPRLSEQLFLRRVSALPGDRLGIRSGRPVVNGAVRLANLVQPCHVWYCNLSRRITVLPEHYFLLGDNSEAAIDSRLYGPAPEKAIIGKVIS